MKYLASSERREGMGGRERKKEVRKIPRVSFVSAGEDPKNIGEGG